MIPGYGSFSTSGQQQIAAQGATVDINDSVLTNNLETLGTIAEHWDTLQAIPPQDERKNNNGKFNSL